MTIQVKMSHVYLLFSAVENWYTKPVDRYIVDIKMYLANFVFMIVKMGPKILCIHVDTGVRNMKSALF